MQKSRPRKIERYIVELDRDIETGVVVREQWLVAVKVANGMVDGGHHRLDGPADIWRDPSTGVTVLETWYKDGFRHREGGPAQIAYDLDTGVVTSEVWMVEGRHHRLDGPAMIRRDPKTGKEIAKWRINDQPFPKAKRPKFTPNTSPSKGSKP